MRAATRIVARAATAPGFAAAGLRPVTLDPVPAAFDRLRALVADRDVGVLLIEESIYDALPDDLRRRLAREPLPLAVPFPGPVWAPEPEAAEAYIVELLRQVIGYRVRLR